MFFSTNRHQACATCKVSLYSAGVGVGGQKAALGKRGFLLAKRKSWALNPKAVDLAAWAPHLVSSLMRVPDFLLGTHPGPSSQVNRCPRPVPVGQSLNSTLQATEMD